MGGGGADLAVLLVTGLLVEQQEHFAADGGGGPPWAVERPEAVGDSAVLDVLVGHKSGERLTESRYRSRSAFSAQRTAVASTAMPTEAASDENH